MKTNHILSDEQKAQLSDFLIAALESEKILNSTATHLYCLDELSQIWIRHIVEELGYYPTLKQAIQIEELYLAKQLTKTKMRNIFIQTKASNRKIEFRYKELADYFPLGYTTKEMRNDILKMLTYQSNKRY